MTTTFSDPEQTHERFQLALQEWVKRSKKSCADAMRQIAGTAVRKFAVIAPATARQGGRRIEQEQRRAFQPLDAKYVRFLTHIAAASSETDGRAASRFAARFQRYVTGGNTAAVNAILRGMKQNRTFAPLTKEKVRDSRDAMTGKIRPGVLLAASPAETAARLAEAKAKVGSLSAGWNASAEKLAVQLADFVGRHTTAQGQIEIDVDGDTLQRIVMTNAVPYGPKVKDYQARVTAALESLASYLEQQVRRGLAKSAQSAGLPAH